MTVADALALARAAAVLPIWYALAIGERGVASAIFVVAALTDAADGWLARRGIATAYGALVDPLADKVLVLGTALALAFAGLEAGAAVPPVLFGLLALRELVSGAIRIAEHRAGRNQPAGTSGKLKTAAEMCALAVLIVARPPQLLGIAALGLLWIAVLFGVVLLARSLPDRLRSAS